MAERVSRGKDARDAVPLSSHGEWAPATDRTDPVTFLEEQAETRVPELVPIRHGRMAASAFAYYRGAALPMAADLATTPRVDLQVQLCGDAHLSNFGGFAAPDRTLVFDVNDFDETNPGPFDWDVKRLAASFEIAARSMNLHPNARHAIAERSTHAYRKAMHAFAARTNLEVWYARLDIDELFATYGDEADKATFKKLKANIAKAKSKDRLKAAHKLTRVVDGQPEFVSDPPLVVPIEELFDDTDAAQLDRTMRDAIRAYSRSLTPERRHLLETYTGVRMARKVVGVGSVGTRAWVVLFIGRDQQDPLILQVKEAEASVLERFVGKSQYATHGQRVVEGQRLMQAASDIFLGYERLSTPDGVKRDYYMRQLWDWKASADVESMDHHALKIYAEMCGWTLARAHARSGDRIAIASYMGTDNAFDRAVADFAGTYAEQNDLDHRAMLEAIQKGRLTATTGI